MTDWQGVYLHNIAEELKNIRKILEKQQSIEVCEDCISRKWLFDKAECGFDKLGEDYDINHMLRDIKNAPSVVPTVRKNRQVERAEGEWLLDGRCSNCLQAPLTTHKTYCPNCGAKMKG